MDGTAHVGSRRALPFTNCTEKVWLCLNVTIQHVSYRVPVPVTPPCKTSRLKTSLLSQIQSWPKITFLSPVSSDVGRRRVYLSVTSSLTGEGGGRNEGRGRLGDIRQTIGTSVCSAQPGRPSSHPHGFPWLDVRNTGTNRQSQFGD